MSEPSRPGMAWCRLLLLGLAVALGVGLAGTHARAAPPELPALVTPPNAEHHVGKVIFAELVTPDLDASERFYATLFGWTFRNVAAGPSRFAQASLNGRVVAGIVQRRLPQGRRPAWLTFMSARDVEQAAAAAAQHGAKVLFPSHNLANLGREAVLADPQGAVFAVLASSSGDPPDLLAEPGEWIWSSLITTDPDSDAAFYKALFGYDLFNLPDPQDARHLVLASENYARASVNPIPSSRPGAHPRWVSYVRVSDATAMAARVSALGGRVLLPPRLDRQGGRIALVADPLGALVGLLEWPGDSPAGEAR